MQRLHPIEKLSDTARAMGCSIEVAAKNHRTTPLFTICQDSFHSISGRLLTAGETTVIGIVMRAGGATTEKCMLRVPGRHRGLYCDVESRDVVRRLGQHLYEKIVATGTATWIYRNWRIYRFKIKDFTQPKVKDFAKGFRELWDAGLDAWDKIEDPAAFIQELRS